MEAVELQDCPGRWTGEEGLNLNVHECTKGTGEDLRAARVLADDWGRSKIALDCSLAGECAVEPKGMAVKCFCLRVATRYLLLLLHAVLVLLLSFDGWDGPAPACHGKEDGVL